jgi:hypothetical protein
LKLTVDELNRLEAMIAAGRVRSDPMKLSDTDRALSEMEKCFCKSSRLHRPLQAMKQPVVQLTTAEHYPAHAKELVRSLNMSGSPALNELIHMRRSAIGGPFFK